MHASFNTRIIKLLCGPSAFERGVAYYKEGKTELIYANEESSVFEAIVTGTRLYRVVVEFDGNGDVDAECDCAEHTHGIQRNCKHIAAVLFHVLRLQEDGRSSVRSFFPSLLHSNDRPETVSTDARLVQGMLGLFDGKPSRPIGIRPWFDARTTLDVEFIVRPCRFGDRTRMLGVELKVGPSRLYVVQRIKEFLDRVDRRSAMAFSKSFIYDSDRHGFSPDDDALLRHLISILRNESLYRETSAAKHGPSSGKNGERVLMIPPYAWDTTLRLLSKTRAVKLEHDGRLYDGISITDEPLPLRFSFDQAPVSGYELDIQGLDQVTVLEPYGMVLFDGKLTYLPAEQCRRLSELQSMVEKAFHVSRVHVEHAQMEPFLEKVVPGLLKFGPVRFADAVADRIVQIPLKAKLFLDRIKNRLLAGLEFQYGDVSINPLHDGGNSGERRILIRDGERESRILALMDQSGFAKTESGYFLDNEEAEYEFLHHVIPQLEPLLKVYATTAVKVRLLPGHAAPKVNVDVDERTDWLEFRFSMDGIPESEVRGVLKSLEEKRKYYRLPNGSLLPLEGEAFQEIIRAMNELGIRKEDLNGTVIRLPAVRGLRLLDADRHGTAVKFGKSFRSLLENMRNPDNLAFPIPASLATVLRDYQKFGYLWMKTLAHYRFGGILADEMGLGKTLQSIAFLVSVLPDIRERQMPALIVCPASLMYNWRNELAKFAPDIRVVIADGDKPARGDALEDLSQTDVIIVSYPLLRQDIDRYAWQTFHTLILDEAQAFKNYATQTAQAVKAIRAEHRFALTGTPVENGLIELWSIFDAVFPGLFPGRQAFAEMSREAVARRIRPFMLRRMKSDVLKELPEKIETLQASELLPEQKKLYAAYLAELQQETLKHLRDNSFQKQRIQILAGLTRLRQLCCHPALFVESYAGGSAKLEQLLEIVEDCRSAGKRMLIFSQFTEMLGLIGRELGYQGVSHFYLDGSTPAAERVELCNRFNEGERDVFLISLKAGGTGLNLTGADTVVLYDLWWNPAVEQQATDRAHRIGQTNVVQVIRLVAQGTVEDKMYALQQRKKNLVDEVLAPGHESLSTLTEADIREILMLG